MPKIDLASVPEINRTGYPEPFAAAMSKRFYRRLGPAAGLSDFGASYVVLKPGGISSQRHWHEEEDEFLVMLSGEGVLVENDSETVLRPGDCASFPKGIANGHHLVNRTDADCAFVVVGKAPAGNCHYSDIDLDLRFEGGELRYTRKDGTPY